MEDRPKKNKGEYSVFSEEEKTRMKQNMTNISKKTMTWNGKQQNGKDVSMVAHIWLK